MFKTAIALIFAILPVASIADEKEVCAEAASKIMSVIEDWHAFVKEYKAEGKNPSVLAMFSDYKSGTFRSKFESGCIKKWSKHSDVYSCFSGVRTEMGAQMCLHPDTNKSDWQY